MTLHVHRRQRAALRLVIDGVELKAHADTGLIFWASDWARVGDLPGLIRRPGGPSRFGHVDYLVPVEPETPR